MAKIFVLLILIVAIYCCVEVSGRGGRGGGGGGGRGGGGSRGGGSRGGSSGGSRGGSRSGGSRGSRSFVRTGSGRSTHWKTAAAAGYIYGWSSHSTRRSYRNSPDSQPTICTNKYDYKMDNGTAYTLFICPKASQDNSLNQCCGPDDRQKCCTNWDKNKGGIIAGIVIGVLVAIGILVITIFCCCRSKRKTASPANGANHQNPMYKQPTVHYTSPPQGPVAHYTSPDNGVVPYDTAPADGKMAPYPTQAAPPYPTVPVLPYPVQPTAPGTAPSPPQAFIPGQGTGYRTN